MDLQPNDKKRIVVVGTSCTGKSTLASDLSREMGLHLVDLDRLYWQPGWIETDKSTYLRSVEEELTAEAWVVSGNITSTEDIVLKRADTVVWLDYSFRVTMARALRRTVKRALFKEVCCNGNYESFRQSFLSSNSILWWVVKSYSRRKRQYKDLRRRLQGSEKIAFLQFTQPSQAAEWLDSVSK